MFLIFDLDDTLIDHASAYRSATASLHQDARSELSFDQFVDQWSTAHRRYFDRYLVGELTYEEQARARVRDAIDASLNDADADRLFLHYIDSYEQGCWLFPDVEPCLQRLTGYRLGILSNGKREQQVKKLARTGILDRFEFVVVPADCGQLKPSKDIFHHACALVGEDPGNVAYVGDAYDLDAMAARRAGLVGVWLDRASQAGSQHEPPIIRSLVDLPVLVDKLFEERSPQIP